LVAFRCERRKMAIEKENELFAGIENRLKSIDERIDFILSDCQKFNSIASKIRLKLTVSNYETKLNEARESLLNKSSNSLVKKLCSTKESYLKCVKIAKKSKSKNSIEEMIYNFICQSRRNLINFQING